MVSLFGGTQTLQGRFLFNPSAWVTSQETEMLALTSSCIMFAVSWMLFAISNWERKMSKYITLDELKRMHLEGRRSVIYLLKNLQDLLIDFFVV